LAVNTASLTTSVSAVASPPSETMSQAGCPLGWAGCTGAGRAGRVAIPYMRGEDCSLAKSNAAEHVLEHGNERRVGVPASGRSRRRTARQVPMGRLTPGPSRQRASRDRRQRGGRPDAHKKSRPLLRGPLSSAMNSDAPPLHTQGGSRADHPNRRSAEFPAVVLTSATERSGRLCIRMSATPSSGTCGASEPGDVSRFDANGRLTLQIHV
jgi:hypothetical protein